MSWDDDADRESVNVYWGYEAKPPRRVKGGLVAESQSGAFAHNWWSKRWLKALTRVASSARLARGRAYARLGQVVTLDVQPGLVSAMVQGTRPQPYRVRIEFRAFTDAEWDRVLDALSGQAMYAAQLLNGEMPHEIEAVFEAAHLPLFPTAASDLAVSCSCPDWAEMCKHVAAVCFLLGERLDKDPFLLLTLRGRTKAQVVEALRKRRASGGAPDAAWADKAARPEGEGVGQGGKSLGSQLAAFWGIGPQIAQVQIRIRPPEIEDELLKLLGSPSFDDKLGARLSAVYRRVSAKAQEIAYAEPESGDGEE
ncbi:MAG: hypothetical protein FJZ90_08580 [Chloroflexi bacterium]|nr:hypothetical protein [Chloroflexota bacterium]